MLHTFEILIMVSMLGVVAVLLGGLSQMAAVGDGAAKRSNRFMVARCLLQGLTLGLLGLAALFTPH